MIRLSSKTFPASTAITLSESDVESYIFDGDNTGITGVVELSRLAIAGNVTLGGNSLYVDSSNDRVGICATAPTATLDIKGNVVIGSSLSVSSTASFSTGIVVGGDYISDFAGSGLTIGSNTLSINLAVGSGLEVGAGGLSLIRTCNASEVLSWSGTQWECSAVGGTIDEGFRYIAGYLPTSQTWSMRNILLLEEIEPQVQESELKEFQLGLDIANARWKVLTTVA